MKLGFGIGNKKIRYGSEVLVIGENDELELWRNKIVERKLRWDGGESERAKGRTWETWVRVVRMKEQNVLLFLLYYIIIKEKKSVNHKTILGRQWNRKAGKLKKFIRDGI